MLGRFKRHPQRPFRAVRLERISTRRERWIVGLGLAGVVALAWLYLWHDAHSMRHPAPFALTALMWVVMMAAMMLPSVTPTVVLYASMVRKNAERGTVLPSAWVFAAGYLLVWAGFGLAAAVLHLTLEHTGLLSPTMRATSHWLTGALLVAAGVYQLTPLKDACLSQCRDPIRFLMARWRPGSGGALRLGAAHGLYCVGCCWALMLLLFAVGVMNLVGVAIITGFVFIEKLLPTGRLTGRFAGVALIVVGLGVAARAV